MKKIKAYCLKDPNGVLMISTSREWRSVCINEFIGAGNNWPEYRKHGWTCVNIEANEVSPPKTNRDEK